MSSIVSAQPTEFVDRSLTELSASPAARLAFMMFASEARKGWALVQEAVVGFFQGKVSASEAANVVAVAWLAVGLLEATIPPPSGTPRTVTTPSGSTLTTGAGVSGRRPSPARSRASRWSVT